MDEPNRSIARDAHADAVRLAFRAVLRREAHPEEVTHEASALAAGGTLLELLAKLAACEEFQRTEPWPTYTVERDPRITSFLTPDVRAFSERLEHERPYPREAYDRAWHDRFEVELGHTDEEERHRQYGRDHERRYWELANAVAMLLEGVERPRVLDCGISVFTGMPKRLFPDIEFLTVDRPVDPDHTTFHERISRLAGATRHVALDLNRADFLDEARRLELGMFDLVIFTEVLEHLTVHPETLFAQLAEFLSPTGQLYLTTPNFFSFHHLQEIRLRMNPQHTFPRSGNDDTHYHFREFGMAEVLEHLRPGGFDVTGFYFSDCWEDEDLARRLDTQKDQRSNMVITARRAC